MNMEWIIVLVIMVAMIVFLFLVFWVARQRAEEQIHELYYKKLEDMNQLAGARIAKLEETEKQIAAAKERLARLLEDEELRKKRTYQQVGANVPQSLSGVFVQPVQYQSTNAREQYTYIRENLCIDPNEILAELLGRLGKGDGACCLYEGILAKFPAEIRYELFTLTEEEQQQVLNEVLTPLEEKVTTDYMARKQAGSEETFDLQGFLDYVQMQAVLTDETIRVYTRDQENPLTTTDPRVCWIQDASICEGCRIQYRDAVFDFAI